VKSPKVCLRDSGLLHSLLNVPDRDALAGHPVVGVSWEGFALEQVLRALRPSDAYYWATHNGAELDLLFMHRGRRFGVEFKLNEAPGATRSMHVAMADLNLKHLWVVYPGRERFEMAPGLSAWPLTDVASLPRNLALRSGRAK
jgi:predicted AAA+ superfamily ATPase